MTFLIRTMAISCPWSLLSLCQFVELHSCLYCLFQCQFWRLRKHCLLPIWMGDLCGRKCECVSSSLHTTASLSLLVLDVLLCFVVLMEWLHHCCHIFDKPFHSPLVVLFNLSAFGGAKSCHSSEWNWDNLLKIFGVCECVWMCVKMKFIIQSFSSSLHHFILFVIISHLRSDFGKSCQWTQLCQKYKAYDFSLTVSHCFFFICSLFYLEMVIIP